MHAPRLSEIAGRVENEVEHMRGCVCAWGGKAESRVEAEAYDDVKRTQSLAHLLFSANTVALVHQRFVDVQELPVQKESNEASHSGTKVRSEAPPEP